jgi:hypothetical protein
MASGSFEIDTYSWYRSLPLSNDTLPYPTGTMFAVGDCTFLKPYSFWQYQSTSGFTDSSTMSVAFTAYVEQSLQSTNASLTSSINYNLREFVSTIPLVKWVSANVTQFSTFIYTSSFLNWQSTVLSPITSTVMSNFTSSGLFGYTTSNIYGNCVPYRYFSTIPVVISSFASSINSNFISSSTSTIGGIVISSLYAPSLPYDFLSTSSNVSYPVFIQFSNLNIGKSIKRLLDTQEYNVFVECQYNVYVSTQTANTPYVWISSIGRFGDNSDGNHPFGDYKGRTTVTRVGNSQYMEVYTKQMFSPAAGTSQLWPLANDIYNMNCLITKPSNSTDSSVYVDIYAPGENNYTLTVVPIKASNY